MTNVAPSKKSSVKEGWETSDKTLHRLNNLQKYLSNYLKDDDDLSEIVMEGERPVIIKRTETNEMIVEISAGFKSGFGREKSRNQTQILTSGKSRKDELRNVFADVDSPAVTTAEVQQRVGWERGAVLHHLTEFEHRGWVESKQSAATTLWWPTDQLPLRGESESLEILPSAIKEGLEKSEEQIKNWVRENKRGDETMEEAYNRIRGNPSPEEFAEAVKSGGPTENNILNHIRNKREENENRKDELKELFNDSRH